MLKQNFIQKRTIKFPKYLVSAKHYSLLLEINKVIEKDNSKIITSLATRNQNSSLPPNFDRKENICGWLLAIAIAKRFLLGK